MARVTHCSLSFLLCLLGSILPDLSRPASNQDPHLDRLIRDIRTEVQADQAVECMRRIHSTDRWFTFPKFHETATYLKRKMEELGLRNVELIDAPADGVSQYGYWTMPLAWDVKQARLEIVAPEVAPEFKLLADYENTPTSLGMWSGPTPPGGVTVEVVELADSSQRGIEKLDLRGKLVLTYENPSNLKWMLARKGALGAINAFTENAVLKDGRQWINAWGDNGWAFTKGNSPLLCFSITPRQTEFLRKLMAERGKVRLKATVDSRYYSGTYPYVTGIIPGVSSEEEVLTLGHTSEQGAQDNATGVAALLESLATLNRLITSGKLPRPQRSIRILAMGEMYGSLHYVATNTERMQHTVAAICLDTPAGFYHLAGTEYTFYLNPHVAKSYIDSLILRIAETYLPRVSPPRPWHWKEYMTGTDTYMGEPTIGVPTVWPYGGSGIHTHHNSKDTPDDVDPRSLRDLAVITSVYLYTVASAGEPEARWLAEIALSRGYEQVLRSSTRLLERVFSLTRKEELSESLEHGSEHISYAVDRESQSVLSVLRLVPQRRREDVRATLTPLLERLRRFGQDQSERVRQVAYQRASQIGLPTPIEPAPPAVDRQLAAASGIVVKRKRIGTIPLDEIPPDQREGYPSGAWAILPITALYWCDGQRNLGEVIRLTRLELGTDNFDYVGYFRFLEKRGYVEFVRK